MPIEKILVLIVTGLYTGTAVAYLFKNNMPMALVFLGYSVANMGFLCVKG